MEDGRFTFRPLEDWLQYSCFVQNKSETGRIGMVTSARRYGLIELRRQPSPYDSGTVIEAIFILANEVIIKTFQVCQTTTRPSTPLAM